MNDRQKIDLNCDLGEGFGVWTLGRDEAIMPYVSSVNIACGFHAGDPLIIMDTIRLALEYGVHIGAHPGFQDLSGFGRREIATTPEEVYAIVLYQIGAVHACAKAQGASLHHVKPHGALYNMSARDFDLAQAIAQAVFDFDPSLILYGLSGSELERAGKNRGLNVFSEVFADRTYQSDGSLTKRSDKNALIYNEQEAVDQVIRMVKLGTIQSLQGAEIKIAADTICIHGDTGNAVQFAKKINKALKDQHIDIR